MNFQDLVTSAQVYFPKLQIKYKDQSWFMKLLGKLLFFNKGFMTEYTTTIGDTVYFPNEKFVKLRQVSSSVILLHELVHLNDQKKMSKPLFTLSYLFPQILVPICLLMIFLVTWKVMLPLALVFSAPIPAFFRMHWEKRAYLSSFYVMRLLGNRLNFDPHLKSQEAKFLTNFHDSSYYFMWPFHDINNRFDQALELAKAGKRPYEDPVFDMIEDLASKV
jgi:hypothetical protein